MNIIDPKAVVGTNGWGSTAYEKVLKGDYAEESVIRETIKKAEQSDLCLFDTAQDYGFGKCQKMMGEFNDRNMIISAKYTPVTKYKNNQVHESFEKDLRDFQRSDIDIYWLHLPNSIHENLSEMIELYKEHKIHYIGISNFNLDECIEAKKILDEADVPLYGVQNHYSLLDRKWEKDGLLEWCKANNVLFWGWAPLEEGILTGKKKKEKEGILDLIYGRKRKKLTALFGLMEEIGKKHDATVAEIAIAYCINKGVVPIVGCRKPERVEALNKAVHLILTEEEIRSLEQVSDASNVKVLKADMFRIMVKK